MPTKHGHKTIEDHISDYHTRKRALSNFHLSLIIDDIIDDVLDSRVESKLFHGMDIILVLTGGSRELSLSMLKLMGLPVRVK